MLIPVQVGGGIRSIETIETLLKTGVDRVVLGTVAIEDPQLVKDACLRYQESIIVSIDARNNMVATRGWVQDTGTTAIELANVMARNGVRRFIYTDIERDGTLTEPNFTAISGLIDEIHLPVIAAGGITSLDHLVVLQKIGAEGAIIGKALYTEDIDLKEALDTLDR